MANETKTLAARLWNRPYSFRFILVQVICYIVLLFVLFVNTNQSDIAQRNSNKSTLTAAGNQVSWHCVGSVFVPGSHYNQSITAEQHRVSPLPS